MPSSDLLATGFDTCGGCACGVCACAAADGTGGVSVTGGCGNDFWIEIGSISVSPAVGSLLLGRSSCCSLEPFSSFFGCSMASGGVIGMTNVTASNC